MLWLFLQRLALVVRLLLVSVVYMSGDGMFVCFVNGWSMTTTKSTSLFKTTSTQKRSTDLPLSAAAILVHPGGPYYYHNTTRDARQLRSCWNVLVPSLLLNEKERGIDVTVRWTVDGNHDRGGGNNADIDPVVAAASDAARRWLDQAMQVLEQSPSASDRRRRTEDLKRVQHILHHDLTQAMQFFTAFCQEHLSISSSSSSNRTYKARIYAGRGPTSAKCPVWHVDQVPVRYIQALVGPGPDWVDAKAVHWDHLRARLRVNPDDDGDNDNVDDKVDDDAWSVEQRNRYLVDDRDASSSIHRVPEGQAVLLLGTRWSELARTTADGSPMTTPLPCVHRSPQGLKPWDGRVFFTMDVVDEMEQSNAGGVNVQEADGAGHDGCCQNHQHGS